MFLILTALSWTAAILLYKSSIQSLGYDHSEPIPHVVPYNQLRKARTSSTPDGMFYFVQISDLHISAFQNSLGIDHLKSFLSVELPILSPEKVVVTGDLTDAKSRFQLTSTQFDQEWHEYYDALLKAGVFSVKDFWLDQRGNHDCFDGLLHTVNYVVASFNHPSNPYRLFSSIKKEGYAIHMRKKFGTYSFVGVDGCPKYGTRRPFNFFGYLDRDDMDFLEDSILPTANHTFIMSHYPSGTLVKGLSSKGSNFESVTLSVSVWFSGHLHNLIAGLGDYMYHRKPNNGFLELELGDMKVNKMYRIVAVDNDVISFRDLSLSSKSDGAVDPIIMITYPKDGRFLTNNEPVSALSKNSFIRFLVWKSNPKEIDFVVSIDGKVKSDLVPVYSGVGEPWKNKTVSVGTDYLPLWTIKWDPTQYNDGYEHTLKIQVTQDSIESSDSSVHQINFRYDGNAIDDIDAGSGGFIISIDFNKFFKIMFMAGYIVFFFGLLVIPKIWVNRLVKTRSYRSWKNTISKWILKSERGNKNSILEILKRFISRWILRLCNMASNHSDIWNMYFIYANFMVCLPWFLGDFVPSSQDQSKRWAFTFLYGLLFLDGTWIPLLDPWAYGIFSYPYILATASLFGTIIPFYLYLSCWYEPLEALFTLENVSRSHPMHRRWYVAFFIAYLWLHSALDVFFMIFYYGTLAVIFNQRTWFLLFIAQNLYKAWKSARFQSVDTGEEESESPDDGISLKRSQNVSYTSYNLRSRTIVS